MALLPRLLAHPLVYGDGTANIASTPITIGKYIFRQFPSEQHNELSKRLAHATISSPYLRCQRPSP